MEVENGFDQMKTRELRYKDILQTFPNRNSGIHFIYRSNFGQSAVKEKDILQNNKCIAPVQLSLISAK